MKKHLRIAKILLAVLLLAAMLCPLIFITAEADHDCTGADCAICHQINLCENLLNSLGTATAVCAAAAAIGAEPIPDSLEKSPLAIPYCIAIMIPLPTSPPAAAPRLLPQFRHRSRWRWCRRLWR